MKFLIYFFLGFLISIPALAWNSHGNPNLGPGNLSINSSVVAWWGFRCYSTAYTGNVAQIVNSNSGKTTIMHCTGGVLDVVAGQDSLATLVTDCNSSHSYCSLTTWYDQSGLTSCSSNTCDMIGQGTTPPYLVISNCPSFTSVNKFCAVLQSNVSAYWAVAHNLTAITTPLSLIMLFNPTTIGGSPTIFNLDGSHYVFITSTYYFYQGTTQGKDDAAVFPFGWGVLSIADLDSASSNSFIQINNGAPVTRVLGNYSSVAGAPIFNETSAQLYVEEAGIWSSDIHSSFTAYYTNASTALGGF